ncbi:NIPSNAP family protein [Paenibacillus sp. 19GGS1-52]|uniref:NIPSNAP family protein n=1 Tax=Paenibacillus sp. 19GGS1-52 TaxID=2758563 RepID=UPI001EFB0516|nr:NIPSNAP family protein [Paenibacillus sp. 19GGS1-52]ULO10078.1 NIPSNAP family protein [Paenibacillus sp. 19GGS1-52]
MIYELRTYHIHPGKMQDILARFKDHTVQLFANHGMNITDFWEDVEASNNRLYYVVEHPDLETRNRNFEDFQKDPVWIEVKRLSELNGPLVDRIDSTFMKKALVL